MIALLPWLLLLVSLGWIAWRHYPRPAPVTPPRPAIVRPHAVPMSTTTLRLCDWHGVERCEVHRPGVELTDDFVYAGVQYHFLKIVDDVRVYLEVLPQ